MRAERGRGGDHTPIYRGVQHYAPELEQRVRTQLHPTNDSWRGDETDVQRPGEWAYLYRALDSAGNTLEFARRPPRHAQAAE